MAPKVRKVNATYYGADKVTRAKVTTYPDRPAKAKRRRKAASAMPKRRCSSKGPHGARCNFGPGHKSGHHGEYHTPQGYRGESWPR